MDSNKSGKKSSQKKGLFSCFSFMKPKKKDKKLEHSSSGNINEKAEVKKELKHVENEEKADKAEIAAVVSHSEVGGGDNIVESSNSKAEQVKVKEEVEATKDEVTSKETADVVLKEDLL